MNNENGSQEWLRLPVRAMQDKDLTFADVCILAYIIDRVDGEKKAVSVKAIMQKTGASERQVQTSIKRLVENKYIAAQTRTGAATLYTQCNVLDPKRPKKEQAKNNDDFDIEEYKEFINDIPELPTLSEQEEKQFNFAESVENWRKFGG